MLALRGHVRLISDLVIFSESGKGEGEGEEKAWTASRHRLIAKIPHLPRSVRWRRVFVIEADMMSCGMVA